MCRQADVHARSAMRAVELDTRRAARPCCVIAGAPIRGRTPTRWRISQASARERSPIAELEEAGMVGVQMSERNYHVLRVFRTAHSQETRMITVTNSFPGLPVPPKDITVICLPAAITLVRSSQSQSPESPLPIACNLLSDDRCPAPATPSATAARTHIQHPHPNPNQNPYPLSLSLSLSEPIPTEPKPMIKPRTSACRRAIHLQRVRVNYSSLGTFGD